MAKSLEEIISDVDAEIDHDETALQMSLEDMLPLIRTKRDVANKATTDLKTLMPPVVSWLNQHEGERLYSEKHNLVGYLKESVNGSADTPFDFVALWEQNQALFKQLVMNGCLRINLKAVENAGALVAGYKTYLGPRPMKQELKVDPLDKR